MRGPLLRGLFVVAALTACRSPSGRWTPADPAAPNRMRSCTGCLTHLGPADDGGSELRLQPRADCADLLAAGQSEMICHVPASLVSRFKVVMDKIAVGDDCQVFGWFVRDTATNLHQLRPVTAIDLYPDR